MAQQAAELFGDAQALIDFRFEHGAAAFALIGLGEADAVVLGPADRGDGAHQGDHRQGAQCERVQCVVLEVQLHVRAAQAEESGDQRGQRCPEIEIDHPGAGGGGAVGEPARAAEALRQVDDGRGHWIPRSGLFHRARWLRRAMRARGKAMTAVSMPIIQKAAGYQITQKNWRARPFS